MTLRRHSSKGKSDCLVVPYTPLYSIWCVCVCAPIWIGEGRRSISVDLRLNCRPLEKPDYLKNATRRRDAPSRTIQNMTPEFLFDWFMPKRKPAAAAFISRLRITPLLKYAPQLMIPLCSSQFTNSPPPKKKPHFKCQRSLLLCGSTFPDKRLTDARWISFPFDFCLSPKSLWENIAPGCLCLSKLWQDGCIVVYLYRRLSNFHLLFISHLDSIDVSFACYSTRLGCQTDRSLCPYSRKKRKEAIGDVDTSRDIYSSPPTFQSAHSPSCVSQEPIRQLVQ